MHKKGRGINLGLVSVAIENNRYTIFFISDM